MASEPPPQKKWKGEGKKKKRQVEADTAESTPKKKKAKGTPSATLGRPPDVGSLPVPEVPLGAAPMAVEQRTSLDEQLEAHLLGTEPPGHGGSAEPDCSQLNSTSGPGHGRILGQTQKVYTTGWSMIDGGNHPHSEATQTDMDTSSDSRSSNDQTPDCERVASKAGSEGNTRRVNAGNSTTNCIEVTHGEGRYHHGNWRMRIRPHGHGSMGGANSTLKQNDS